MKARGDRSDRAPNRKAKRRRAFWVILIIVAVVLAVGLVVLPAWLSSESGRRMILTRVNRAIDGEVDAQTLSIGWFRGIEATEVTYADAEGDASVRVNRLTTRPRLVAIMRGDLALGRTVLESPQVMLTVHEEAVRREPEPVELPRAVDLRVSDGNARINYASGGHIRQTVEFRNIQSRVDLKPPGRTSTFDVSMAVAEDGPEAQIKADGSVDRPRERWTLRGTTGDFRVNIDNLDLAMLTPVFALMGRDIAATGQLNAEADVRVEQGRIERMVAQADLRDYSQTVAGQLVEIEEPVTIDIDVSTPEDALEIRRFDISSPFLTVQSSGTVDTIDYEATADLGRVHELVSQFTELGGYAFQGAASSRGRVNINRDVITVSGQALTEQLVISRDDVTTPPTNANIGFNVERSPEYLRIPALRVMADLGRVEITDSIIPADREEDETQLNLAADIDLARVQPFVALAVDVPEDVEFGGRLTSETSLTGTNGVYHLVTERTNVRDLVIASPDREPFRQETVRVAIDVVADTGSREITINDLLLEGAMGESLIQVMKGRFGQTEAQGQTSVTGELEARYDLAAVTAMGAAFLPAGLALEGTRTMQLVFESQFPTGSGRFFQNLSGTTGFGFQKAMYAGLNIGPADIALEAQDGLMTIDVPTTPVNDGSTRFPGNINFEETPRLLRMAAPTQLIENVNINDEMSRRLLIYITPLFADQINVSGIANFQCDRLIVPLDQERMQEDLEMMGTVQLDQVRLQPRGLLGQLVASPTLLTVFPTRVILQDGFVNYEDMQTLVGEHQVNFSGRIGLDRTIDMTTTFPLALLPERVRGGADPERRVTVPVEGTLDNPTINIARVIEELGRRELEEELRRREEELRRRLDRIFR